MQYFAQFPLIPANDYEGNNVLAVNIMERVEVIPKLLNNSLLFYAYNIQETDTPDIIASKYYNDSYRYWMVPFANQTIDIQANWPMNQSLFNDYLLDKYANTVAGILNVNVANVTLANVYAYTSSTIQNYLKNVITYDSSTSNTTVMTYIIDANAYANTQQTTSNNTYFAGSTQYVTQTITTSTQSIFDYEVSMNDGKRNINLLNSDYSGPLEKQLTSLLSN